MLLYLAAAPARLNRARQFTDRLAHAAYRIGENSRLSASSLPQQVRGGLMLLSDLSAPAVSHPDVLCRDILQECSRRSFSGVVLDFEAAPTADRIRLVRTLDEMLPRQNRALFVPEVWGTYVHRAGVLICTGLSGGSLRLRLDQAKARFSPRPLALDCQRLAMDFLLPSPNGEGLPLSIDQLRQLRQGRAVYFSEDLCARYFTCSRGKKTHFILFDDADTIRRKLCLAESLGYAAAFVMLPEIDDLLCELFPGKE